LIQKALYQLRWQSGLFAAVAKAKSPLRQLADFPAHFSAAIKRLPKPPRPQLLLKVLSLNPY